MKAAVSKRWLDSSAVVAGKPSPEALGKEKAASYSSLGLFLRQYNMTQINLAQVA